MKEIFTMSFFKSMKARRITYLITIVCAFFSMLFYDDRRFYDPSYFKSYGDFHSYIYGYIFDFGSDRSLLVLDYWFTLITLILLIGCATFAILSLINTDALKKIKRNNVYNSFEFLLPIFAFAFSIPVTVFRACCVYSIIYINAVMPALSVFIVLLLSIPCTIRKKPISGTIEMSDIEKIKISNKKKDSMMTYWFMVALILFTCFIITSIVFIILSTPPIFAFPATNYKPDFSPNGFYGNSTDNGYYDPWYGSGW